MERKTIRNRRIIELFDLDIEALTRKKILEMIDELEKFSDDLDEENKLFFNSFFGICGKEALSKEELEESLNYSRGYINLKIRKLQKMFLDKLASKKGDTKGRKIEFDIELCKKIGFLYRIFPDLNFFLLPEEEIDKLVTVVIEIIDTEFDDMDKFILKSFFGICGHETLKLVELASIVNVTRPGVSYRVNICRKKILLELNERKMLDSFNSSVFDKKEWIKSFFNIYNKNNNDFYVSGVKNKVDKLFLDIDEAISVIPTKFASMMKLYIYLISVGKTDSEVFEKIERVFDTNVYMFRNKTKKYIDDIVKTLVEKELIYLDKKGQDVETQNNSFLFVEDRYNNENIKMLDFLNSGVDVIGIDQYVEILNILKKGDFNFGSYNFSSKEIVIIYLCFGYFNNKFFTPMSVADFLSEEYSFVQSTILKYFDFYREGCSEIYSEVLKRAFINVNK